MDGFEVPLVARKMMICDATTCRDKAIEWTGAALSKLSLLGVCGRAKLTRRSRKAEVGITMC